MAAPDIMIADPSRRWLIDRRRAVAVAAGCWACFTIILWLTVSGRSASFDMWGLLVWRDADLRPGGPEFLLEAARDVTALGGVLLRNLIALGAVVALLFLRMRGQALWLTLTVLLGWLAGSTLKAVVSRARPDIVPHLMDAGGASFPSGHSLNSAIVYLSLALVFATMSARQSVRVALVATALLVSLAVAWSRVWLGVHYPTDVIAGWLGGTGWAFLAATLLPAGDLPMLAGRTRREAPR